MPRLTGKKRVSHEHVTTARLTFFEWALSLASAKVTSTPQRGNRAPRLKKLKLPMKQALLALVDQKDDDPLVKMFDIHIELQTLYTTVLAFFETSSTGHGTSVKELYTLVTTGVTVDGSAGGASGASNTLTKTNYEALKTQATTEMTTQLKEGHKPFPHIVRFMKCMDDLLLGGKCDARSCSLGVQRCRTGTLIKHSFTYPLLSIRPPCYIATHTHRGYCDIPWHSSKGGPRRPVAAKSYPDTFQDEAEAFVGEPVGVDGR